MDLFEARRLFDLTDEATERGVTRRYRQLAKLHHPDMTGEPGGTLDFGAIAMAYELLRDDALRRSIDARNVNLHRMLLRHLHSPQEGSVIDVLL